MSIWRRWVTIMTLSTIIMFASGCGGEARPDSSLEETYWKLLKINGTDVPVAEKQREAHLVLKAEKHRVSGSGGCNRIMGGYTVDGDSLRFSKIAGTMMMCPNISDEQQFLQTLEKVETYEISGEEMKLLQDGKVTLVFKAVYLQ